MSDLGWFAVHSDTILEGLRRAKAGEEPDLIFAELWANSDHETDI